MMFYEPIQTCRMCASKRLETALDLGVQALTGVFPRADAADVPGGPLVLVRCVDGCGLVQLAGNYSLEQMYGSDYGYRSGLNASMVRHLHHKVTALRDRVPVGANDIVVDIGSNDGTTLGAFPRGPTLVGIDPTIAKFGSFYRDDIVKCPAFFDADTYRGIAGAKQAKLVTSISMFYDLPAPLQFVRDIASILAADGRWHFEQSYLPLMLERNSYDTACHEHVEYYALAQIVWLLDRAGLCIEDVELNDVNGGSFAVTARHGREHAPKVQALLEAEEQTAGPAAWTRFTAFVERHRTELPARLRALRDSGKTVFGLGASTKGNVTLQYCGIDATLLPAIAEVNPDKLGCVTPGTKIPIESEAEIFAKQPDVLMVLPWHFRTAFLSSMKTWLDGGGRLLFPLPQIELVGGNSAPAEAAPA
jgi:NDP-4-keto-2,6-dideoxyhexose 3-C-methyltransferase